ncbi:MAG: pyridoxamine 5'-phosphate oxidase [Parasphingorhabdus sp.]|jgi:pyridoxamine 5'-phosphate oxidase
MKISDLRADFSRDGLDEADLQTNPFEQFEKWFQEAGEDGIEAPNAMSLATASASGFPTVRTVLLKSFDEDGFVFFTNYGSRKAQQLDENPQAAILFPWITMGRQVNVKGRVARVSARESLSYFLSRPRGSQLGAWASNQSSPVSSRGILEQSLVKIKQRFKEGEIPLPDFWGGYRITPLTLEFWQSRKSRLHDRFEYSRDVDGNWIVTRLNP